MLKITHQFATFLQSYFRGTVAMHLAFIIITLAFSAGCWTGALQYNIGNGAGRHGEQDIIWLIRDKGLRPLAITLNEVCGKRYQDIAVAIHDFGYRGYFDATDPTGCGASHGGRGFGNAIFYLGEGITADHDPYVNNDPDNRKALCVKARLGQFAYIVCTTHLDNKRPMPNKANLASKQALEFFYWVNRVRQKWGNLPTIVGGDFNLTPDQLPMSLWYAHYEEVDGSPYNAKSTYSNEKIDYLFYSPGFIQQSDAVVASGKSDHKMLIGLFTKR